jgi:hypothetical protein
MAIAEGKPEGRFCLMPTAAPIDAELAPGTERNYLAMIAAALGLARY